MPGRRRRRRRRRLATAVTAAAAVGFTLLWPELKQNRNQMAAKGKSNVSDEISSPVRANLRFNLPRRMVPSPFSPFTLLSPLFPPPMNDTARQYM